MRHRRHRGARLVARRQDLGLELGAVTAEIYPTDIRATAQGLCYNVGRIASAAAPFAVGTLAQSHGFGLALSTASIAFIGAAFCWVWIPETRGRELVG